MAGMQYFNIQIASQLSGVASATIRAWEKRYSAVVPERADNKHRLYSEKDIEKLALLFRLTEFGQSIGKIAHLGLDELKEIYATLMHRPYDEMQVVTLHHERVDYEKILSNLLIALYAYKLDIISHELEKTRDLISPRDFCLHILIPLFHEIGNKVERNELSIAQEHTLSAIVAFHTGQLIGRHYQKKLIKQDLILISTPEGELHEIGILASALLCVHYGIPFVYMGPNLPALSLSDAANALKAKVILLGMGHKDETKYLSELSADLKTNTDIWVGGPIKESVKQELVKRKINYFPTIQALDTFLSTY